jgi:hypothetical protein
MNTFIEIPANKNSLGHRRPIFGIGINDAWYMTQLKNSYNETLICPYYKVWKSMLGRCYYPGYQVSQPTYKGCLVVSKWLIFSSFREWMENQDWSGKQLDKDILRSGNKEYSPKACMFISGQINYLLNGNAARRGEYPQGVSFHKPSSKYRATCSVKGSNKHVGLFISVAEAELAYLEFKSLLVESIAELEENKLKAGLLRHVAIMRSRISDIKNKY